MNQQEPAATRVAWPKRLRRGLLRMLTAAVIIYVAVCGGVWAFQERLIYFPATDYYSTPADLNLDYQDVTLIASDGVRISAWYIPRGDAIGSVIFCHGNAGNMGDRLHTIDTLHRMGLNVLIFDYHGYGSSEGSPNEQATYDDAEAAWNWLCEVGGESPERIVIYGRSLGGAVAVELALMHGPAALVVESSFTSLVAIGQQQYPLLPISLLARNEYQSIQKVGRIRCPKFFIHGRDDELVPFENGKRLFEAAATPKQFMETPGGHNASGFTYSPKHTKKVAKFIRQSLSGG